MHGENTHARTSWGYQNWGFIPGVREEDFRSPTQPHGCLFTQAGTLKVPGKMLTSLQRFIRSQAYRTEQSSPLWSPVDMDSSNRSLPFSASQSFPSQTPRAK